MLAVKRKKGESILIGDNIEITIVDIENASVKIAIDAPRNITILRKELYKEIEEENKKAVSTDLDFSILKNINKK